MAESLSVLIEDELSPEAISATIASVARESLAEAQATNAKALGKTPPHESFVDGRKGAILESVAANGSIVFVFELALVGEALTYIAEQLVLHSPRLTGRYSESHMLFADGVQMVATDTLREAKEFAFVNSQPYARKIERGLSSQAPEGVFQGVAKMASRRFGNVAMVRFGYRSLPSGAVGAWASRTRMQSHSPSRNRPGVARTDWLTRQPAIVVTPR